MNLTKIIVGALLMSFSFGLSAQEPVQIGAASYAAYPPLYKGRTDAHNGDLSSLMQTKKLYINESDKMDDGQRRPLPTNDWWTGLINAPFADALWAYPQMVHPFEAGITINYPSYWNENGTEVKSNSNITIKGVKFTAVSAIAHDWHDWDVEMLMSGADGKQEMYVTLAHGIPFTWIELKEFSPRITFSSSAEYFDVEGNKLDISDILSYADNKITVKIGSDYYGIFVPDATGYSIKDGALALVFAETKKQFISVGMMKNISDLKIFAEYAYSVPRKTTVSWNFDEYKAELTTKWQIDAENLLDKAKPALVMQGFLPHAYKDALSKPSFQSESYLSPRGRLKIATPSSDNIYTFSYRFSGMLPYYAAPKENNAEANPYIKDRMTDLMTKYAKNGTFGNDTYWGGKGLTQMALNMTFAHEMGDEENFKLSKDKLKAKLIDWLTFTPGEEQVFFSYYPRWGSLVGHETSYDSDAFNDHHFHYGYFIYSGALLCMMDKDFRLNYGPMLRLIAKDYANWEHDDSQFPFLRTLDPWAGHSYAGGLGDNANSNGNGQESSSEAMQSWGAIYLLGVALNDNAMRDAGIFGWSTESRATAEYWFDRDQIHPEKEHNYDYTLYTSPYCTNLTSKGIGWWTWFSGDALWMHSIQWMPVSPCLNYLSQDLDFVKWDYDKMMSATAYKWFDAVGTNAPLANQSVGNVVLCYMERSNPDEAAKIFDRAYEENYGIATGIDTGHISYFTIQSHRTYGDIDFSVHADILTATAYKKKDGSMTYMAYNSYDTERMVRFFKDGTTVATVKVPARSLVAYGVAAVASSVVMESAEGLIMPPSAKSLLSVSVLDQYGATMDDVKYSFVVSDANLAFIDGKNILNINATATKGSKFTVTVKVNDDIKSVMDFTVNDIPVIASASITPQLKYLEKGDKATFTIDPIDQYGNFMNLDIDWTITKGGKKVSDSNVLDATEIGIYDIEANIGGKKYTQQVYLTPKFNNVALNKTAISSSEENVGTPTKFVNDGDNTTRWGSNHNENEWIYVDLGENCYISKVNINWEDAYGSIYDIQIASDGATTEQFNGIYAGTTVNKTVISEKEWKTVVSVTDNASKGDNTQVIGTEGRYVRMKGIKRATNYGYSIKEFEVFGIPKSLPQDGIIGIDILSPDFMDEDDFAILEAKAYTLDGKEIAKDVAWECEAEKATIDGNKFAPSTYGRMEVTAKSSDGYSAVKNIMVNEVVKLKSLKITPENTQILLGDDIAYSISGLNQFGGEYEFNTSTLAVEISNVTDPENVFVVTDGSAYYHMSDNTFGSTKVGDYNLKFVSGNVVKNVLIGVADVSKANLALNRQATSSSSYGINTASKINDGDVLTRWESDKADGEYVTIDLESPFVLDRMNVIWEAAYATNYHVMASMNGDAWTNILTKTDGDGATDSFTISPVPAQYVRLICDKRAVVDYANSIYEWEIYGLSRFTGENDNKAPVISGFNIQPDGAQLTIKANANDDSGYIFYTLTRTTSGVINGNPVEVSSYSKSGEEISITSVGLKDNVEYIYTLTATDPFGNKSSRVIKHTAEVSIDGVNLALNKYAYASSAENPALVAQYAVDGNSDTRWGSEFNDNEWITVDLADAYLIDNIKIKWNNFAFATNYDVSVSIDGDKFDNIYSKEGFVGGEENIVVSPTAARYIRIVGLKRSSIYGTSIDELEVYGSDMLLSITGAVRHNIRLEGRWDNKIFAALDSKDATSYDVTSVSQFPESITTLNPNCLIYVPSSFTSALHPNMVKVNEENYQANSIELYDGFNFESLHDISVGGDMEFNKSMTGAVIPIILPFPIEGTESMKIALPDTERNDAVCFYLSENNKSEANQPIVLKLTTSISKIKGAGNILYRSSTSRINQITGTYMYKPAFEGEYRWQNGVFVRQISGDDFNPFELVVEYSSNLSSELPLKVTDVPTGIEETREDMNVIVDVYNIWGIKIRAKILKSEAFKGLLPGVYISNGEKIIVR